jgi:phosphoglycolate phosphatase
LVAFTDSSYFATLRRVRQLDLVDVFERIFCRAKSETIPPLSAEPAVDNLAAIITELPASETKPDPAVLKDIALTEMTKPSSIAYVGDSISKDVLMARKAGCFAIWAKYGVRRDPVMYNKLVRISHWTEEDIVRERNFAQEASTITPDFICENSISELLGVLEGPGATRVTG